MRCTTFAVVLVSGFAPPLLAADRPNILVIVSDDMGYADVGFHGSKDIPTPHLDALAKSGVRFTNGYVSGTYCSPTRAGLMTGRYQARFGHEFNPVGKVGMPVSEKTIAERFQAAGYRTGLVGKWHLGARPEMHPTQRGFDEFFGFLGGSSTYFPAKSDRQSILRGMKVVKEQEYLTDAFGREAVSFIERNKAAPFFLYLAFNAPHVPLEADEARLQKFASLAETPKRQPYAALVSAMDDAVGRVTAKLREAKLEKNTLVFFFSDNGGPAAPTLPGTTSNGSSNEPLRGSKRLTLEGGIRVPFVMAWPGTVPAGTLYDRPVIQLDVSATSLSAAGIRHGPEDKLDGVNLLPFVTSKTAGSPHESLFWRFGEEYAIRKGDWKLVKYFVTPPNPNETWPKLYNVAKDVSETNDLAALYPDRVKELEAEWQAWNRNNIAPLWAMDAKHP